MSQRIHLNPNRDQQNMNMGYAPQSYTPDPIGGRTQAKTSDNEIVAQIQQVSSKIEDAIEQYSQVSAALEWSGMSVGGG